MACSRGVIGLLVVLVGACSSSPDGEDSASGLSAAMDDTGSGGTPSTDGATGDDGDDGTPSTSTGTDDDADATGGTDTGMPSDETSTGEPADSGDTGPDPVELLFLSVDPPETILEVDLDTPTSQDFVVYAHYDDGTTTDVTAMIESWSV